MKRNIYSLLLIIALISSCKSIDDGDFSHFDEAPLFGMIYDSESSPVTGAVVVLDDKKSSQTDINGRVLFSAVSQGDHSVVITKEGFEDVQMVINFSTRNQVLYSTLISIESILDNLENALSLGKIIDAESFLGRASKIDSNNIRVKYLNIVFLTKTDKLEEALKEIDFLMESYPNDPYLILTHTKITGETNDQN
ncbi:MAG: hypothetical protein DRP58_10175 [Spirochaetes bacterium]|nr:MAG: hypothetical protein DRP58_10175 [Spirochaetota bacterium]